MNVLLSDASLPAAHLPSLEHLHITIWDGPAVLFHSNGLVQVAVPSSRGPPFISSKQHNSTHIGPLCSPPLPPLLSLFPANDLLALFLIFQDGLSKVVEYPPTFSFTTSAHLPSHPRQWNPHLPSSPPRPQPSSAHSIDLPLTPWTSSKMKKTIWSSI